MSVASALLSVCAASCLLPLMAACNPPVRHEESVRIADEGGHLVLRVSSARPLANAADVLMEKFGVPIGYEDPPFVFGDDLRQTCPAWYGNWTFCLPGMESTILFPRAYRLSGDLGQDGAVRAVADAVVREKDRIARGGSFAVVEGVDVPLSLVPRQLRDRSGRVSPVTAILDNRITLPEKDWGDSELVAAFCAELSRAAGIEVVPGSGTPGITGGLVDDTPSRYRFGADDELARHVLARALRAIAPQAGPRAWRILYGPDPKGSKFYLNLTRVIDSPERIR